MNRPANLWNILFITADQLRADALGCYGNTVVRTPHIDALAQRGICFDRVFAAFPVCAPNRASIATGRYPSVHGVKINGVLLPTTELTLMEVLRRRGYGTYAAGKMHFTPLWKNPPDGSPLLNPGEELACDPQPQPWQLPWYGFEKAALMEGLPVGLYADYLKRHGFSAWDDPHGFSYPQHQCARSAYPEAHHHTTWIADRAIELIEKHDPDRPLFCWCSFYHPHHPFTPPAPFDTMYNAADMPFPKWRPGEAERWPEYYRQRFTARSGSHEAVGMCDIHEDQWRKIKAYYYGMVSLIDKQVGRLVEALRRRGILDQTLIVLTSDHGEMLGDHHLVFKDTTFDEVTRTPLMVVRPGATPAYRRSQALGCSIDLMPTLLDLCGLPVPAEVQGVSLAGAWDHAAFTPREAVLIETDFALPETAGGARENPPCARAVRTPEALLTWHGPNTRGELYDLTNDPDCFVNLWDQPRAAGLQRAMTDRLIQLMIANSDPWPPKVAAC